MERAAAIGRKLLAGVLAACAVALPAAADAPSEPQLKAAFVLSFIRYVDWPDGTFPARDTPVTICLLGHDPVEAALQQLEGRLSQGRPVHVHLNAGLEDMPRCQVAYLGESEARRLGPTLHAIGARPVLTVGDAEGFVDAGGAIGIVRGDERLQFEINRGALEQAHLKASSQLLRLARAIVAPGER